MGLVEVVGVKKDQIIRSRIVLSGRKKGLYLYSIIILKKPLYKHYKKLRMTTSINPTSKKLRAPSILLEISPSPFLQYIVPSDSSALLLSAPPESTS